MFSLTYSTPSEIAGDIRVNRFLDLHIGSFIDADGKRWNIWGLQGGRDGGIAWAVPEGEVHPYYTDTSGCNFGMIQQTWKPYRIVIEEIP
jgi:hypothetical protein